MPININGGSYSAGDWWSKHLEKTETNERVEIIGFTNLSAETIPDAFREMEALAAGTRCKNYFYQANINPRADEHLTPEQRDEAVERLEKNLGLTGQPRFVVEHQKEGRTHWHVVWSRIDTENMKAISDSLTAAIHERTSRELEIRFDLERGQSILVPNRDLERPERRPRKSETFRDGIDPEMVKADARACREQADNGQSFRTALEESGDYVLARGDRRDFVIIDRAGDDHSLARRLGMKAADVRTFMADIDPASLPSVAEAKAQQEARHATQERQQRPEPTPEMAAAEGLYSELRASQTESQFAAGAERTTAPRPESFDRDAADAAWQTAIESAAVAAHQAPQKPQRVPKATKDRPTAEGRYAALETPEPPPEPPPERELTGTAAEIRMAWATSPTASELEDALAARGISLALVSAEEAYASERRAALAKEAGNFAPVWREGEIVAIDGRGSIHRLNERTTGDERGKIEGWLVGIDRDALMNVADTQEAMRAASLEAWKAERRDEREQARLPSAIETTIAEALRSTMTGTEFADAIDKKDITIARAIGNDVKMIEAVRAADVEAGTTGALASGHRFADLLEGDFAAVTRHGDVFRLSPQKLDLEEIEQRLLDVQTSLPTVTRAYSAAQENRERQTEEREQRQADFISDRIEQADIFAGKQELRQATRAAEKIVEAAFETPVAAADLAVDAVGSTAGGIAKVIADFIGGFFNFFAGGPPKLTPVQAELAERAAEEQATDNATRDVAAERAARLDDLLSQIARSDDIARTQRHNRTGGATSRDQPLERDDDYGRERER